MSRTSRGESGKLTDPVIEDGMRSYRTRRAPRRARIASDRLALAAAAACIGAAVLAPPAVAVGAPPNIAEVQAIDVGERGAEVSAVITTEGAATAYQVEYGESEAYGAVVPAGGRAIGLGDPGTGKATIGQQLNDLSASTTYHYRVVAENSYGTTATTDHTFTTFQAQPPGLPDGRAYEMVSPPEKNGAEITAHPESLMQAATNGDAVAYQSFQAFDDSQSSQVAEYMSRRTTTGWSTQPISPPDDYFGKLVLGGPAKGFSEDLSSEALVWEHGQLTPEAPIGFGNLYLRDGGTGAYTLITTTAPPERGEEDAAEFFGASRDYRTIVFGVDGALTENAAPHEVNVYQWSNGRLTLVDIAPGSTTALGGWAKGVNAVSADGRFVFWYSAGDDYVRVDGLSTLKLNASKRSPSLGDGSATFEGATPSGELAFFTDSTPLTNAAGDKGGLYEFDTADEELVDLTPDESSAPGVESVVGYGDDGAYVYFVADGALATGAVSGKPNLYVAHAGALALVATLSEADKNDWNTERRARHATVTPDGTRLSFMATESLTGYDNRDELGGQRDNEVFEYDAVSAKLSCASCNPTGERPVGPSKIPTWASNNDPLYNPEYLTDDGARLFFESQDALVPSDTNGQADVYERERDGVGDCNESDGCVRLLSGGVSDGASLLAAAANGEDVFFFTRDKLVPADVDDKVDLYDARVGGGFPTSSASSEVAECEGDACLGPLSAPPASAMALTAVAGGPVEETDPQQRHATFRVTGVGAHALRAAARTGSLTLHVSVSAAGGLSARATAELRGRRMVVARASARARGAEDVPLTFALDRAARAALARNGRLRVAIAVAYSLVRGSKQMALTLGSGRSR